MTTETDTLANPAVADDADWQPGPEWEPWGDGLRARLVGYCWATVAPVPRPGGGTAFTAIVDGELLYSFEPDHPLLFRREPDAIAEAVEAVQARVGNLGASRRNAPDAAAHPPERCRSFNAVDASVHDRFVDKWLYALSREATPQLAAWRHSTRQECDVWTLHVSGRSAAVVQIPFYRVWRLRYAVLVDGHALTDDAGAMMQFVSLLPAMRAAESAAEA